jgi:SAM-dependent methyltransferase
MRELVGPVDDVAFDNPTGAALFPYLDSRIVLDFGSGCGRLARQFAQQAPPPERYVGLDLHQGMVQWCTRNLVVPGFEFHHHNAYEMAFNPSAQQRFLPLQVESAAFTLIVAWSVFTHILENEIPLYLAELARALAQGGTCVTTWFLFDKVGFPMLQEEQNALYINPINPTNAVIYDRDWLVRSLGTVGLKIVEVAPPLVRGFQWTLHLAATTDERAPCALPIDSAPPGRRPPPVHGVDAHRIGLEET